MLSSKNKQLYSHLLVAIWGGTMLDDKRLQGQFAFVMYWCWGDLRQVQARVYQSWQNYNKKSLIHFFAYDL